MVKRIGAFLWAVVMATMIAGCTGNTGDTGDTGNSGAGSSTSASGVDSSEVVPSDNKDTYTKVRVQVDADVGSFTPWGTDGTGRYFVMTEIFETLFYQRDFGGEPVPLLASGYTMVNDTVARVSINENIYDTAGNHITASDVVFSYETCIAEGNLSIQVGNIVSVKATGEYEVEFEIIEDQVGVMRDTLCTVRVVSQAAYEKDKMESVPVGTGPYVLSDWTTGSTVTLVKNPNYWNDGNWAEIAQANVDEIVYKVISEPSQRLIALETGEVDYTSSLAVSDIYRFLEGGEYANEFTVHSVPATFMQCMFFNCSPDNPFSNVKLRQAFSYAIDNTAILEGAYDGLGNINYAFGSPKYSDYLDKWESEDYYGCDLEKAKQLMKEAGYENGMTVTLMCNASPTIVMVAQIIQLQLAEIGVEVKINFYDDSLFNTYRYDPTQWDIYIASQGAYTVAQLWKYNLDAVLYKGTTRNFMVDETLQEMYQVAINNNTHTPENIDKVWRYIKEVNPIYAICYSYDYFVGTKGIDSIYLNKEFIVPGACTYSADFVGNN